MKLPSSTEVYLAMIPRRCSLVSCFGSGSESMSSSMIAVVLFSIRATECSRPVVFMWVSRSRSMGCCDIRRTRHLSKLGDGRHRPRGWREGDSQDQATARAIGECRQTTAAREQQFQYQYL